MLPGGDVDGCLRLHPSSVVSVDSVGTSSAWRRCRYWCYRRPGHSPAADCSLAVSFFLTGQFGVRLQSLKDAGSPSPATASDCGCSDSPPRSESAGLLHKHTKTITVGGCRTDGPKDEQRTHIFTLSYDTGTDELLPVELSVVFESCSNSQPSSWDSSMLLL